jgi:two-component system chemotaxis response regulator CheY
MNQHKILIVEDSLLLHRMYQLILYPFTNGRGMSGLLHAYDGAQGAALLRQHPDTSLIILDTTLPGESGLEFLRRCKQDPRVRDIPVVVITTEGKEEHIRAGLQAGAYAYVTKPFKPKRLQDLVGAVFHLREAQG